MKSFKELHEKHEAVNMKYEQDMQMYEAKCKELYDDNVAKGDK